MSKRSAAKLRPPVEYQPKTAVGSRAFVRRARALQPRAARRALPQTIALSWLPDPWSALKRMPRTAWLVALVALLSAVSWSLITPAFEVPDEPDHVAYVKQLADTGTLPTIDGQEYALEEQTALNGLHYHDVRQNPGHAAIFSQEEQSNLEQSLDESAETGEKGSAQAGVAQSEPPLYYALQTIPYSLGSDGNLLDRVQLMRLLSALMAGFTALFAYLFLREVLPSRPYASTVGGLAVSLSPLFGFMSGAVNPDALLYTMSAALFYFVARAFRRGFTTSSAVATGLVIVAGFATKLNFVGLAPGAFLALALLAWREARTKGRIGLREPAIAAGIGCLPILGALVLLPTSGGVVTGNLASLFSRNPASMLRTANYLWQLYLPRLPGTANLFPGLFPMFQIWFKGYVGRLGWLDTFFPGWVYTLAVIVALAIAGLCIRALIVCRAAIRPRVAELLSYLTMAVGLIVVVGLTNYDGFPRFEAAFGETRYLLPLLPLFGLIVALAVLGAGRRWSATVGALLLVLFLGHELFSQLQVIGRFYG